MEYNIEKLTKNRIHDILPLFKTVFNKNFSFEYVLSKYSTAESGEDLFGFIAYDLNGKAVAFYGSVPHLIKYEGKPILVAQSSDAMTHPDHLRKGLFLKLAQHNFDYCKLNGVKLIYGFPNENSTPGFKKKLNWEFNEKIHVWIFKTKGIPFLWLKRKIPFLQSIIELYQQMLFRLLSTSAEPYESSVIGDSHYGVLKTESYLNYKLKHSESKFFRFQDKLVWAKRNEMYLQVGDIEKCDSEVFNNVLWKLKILAKISGIPHIRFNVNENSALSLKLNSIIERDVKEFPIGYLLFDKSIDMGKIKFVMADNDTF